MLVNHSWRWLMIGAILVLSGGMVAAQQPLGVPTTLPVPDQNLPLINLPGRTVSEEKPMLKDVTPPELAHPVEGNGIHDKEEGHADAHEGGIYGSLEFLLLRPRQRGLEYALIDPVDDIRPQGQLQSVRHDLRAGFRIGMGYRIPKSAWDVAFYYTYLHSRGDETAAAPAGGLLYPQLTRPGLIDSAQSASASSRINYNLYDIEFGKTLDIDEWTKIRLYSGIRLADINQSIGANYQGRLADNAFAESRSDFVGAGPILGTELRWNVGHGFALFGRGHGGLIFGRTRSSLVETNNGGATLNTDVDDVYRPVIPVIGLALGASWQYRGLTVSAGYQAINWFGLIQRPALVDDFSEGKLLPRSNDLSLDGFFFQLGFDF